MRIRRWLLAGLVVAVAIPGTSHLWGQAWPPTHVPPPSGQPLPVAGPYGGPVGTAPAPAPAPVGMPPAGAATAAPAPVPYPYGPYGPYGPSPGPGVAPPAAYVAQAPPVMAYAPPVGSPVPPPEAQQLPGNACPQCGGAGCDYCLGVGHHDFDVRILRWLLPYGAGGLGEQRFYNIYADVLYLRREEVSRLFNFTSDGVAGPIVLSSNSLDMGRSPAFRVGGAIQVAAGATIEASYMGQADFDDYAQVTSTDNLFSVMSQFGTAPPGGFDDTDNADFHSIRYGSQFDSVELMMRKRWVGPNCRIQGSYLYGARFFELDEGFEHRTIDDPFFMDYRISTYNALVGPQIGGDLWLAIIPGLRVGAEAKVGLYGRRSKQHTVIAAASLANPVVENLKKTGVSFIGEAQLMMVWRLSYRWTFRAGWEFLYVDTVALALENFNAGPPFVVGQRTPAINTGGNIFMHGGFLGFEWRW